MVVVSAGLFYRWSWVLHAAQHIANQRNPDGPGAPRFSGSGICILLLYWPVGGHCGQRPAHCDRWHDRHHCAWRNWRVAGVLELCAIDAEKSEFRSRGYGGGYIGLV